jgi:hypothetical protein
MYYFPASPYFSDYYQIKVNKFRLKERRSGEGWEGQDADLICFPKHFPFSEQEELVAAPGEFHLLSCHFSHPPNCVEL